MIVYKITNRQNGMIYIGCTKQTAARRWAGHRAAASRGKEKSRLYRAIRKYGASSFAVEAIGRANSVEEMYQLERELISLHRSRDRRIGYNLSEGGLGAPGIVRTAAARKKSSVAISVEERARRSVRSKAYWAKPENRDHHRLASKAYWSVPGHRERHSKKAMGRVRTEAAKSKQAAANRGKKATQQTKDKFSKAARERDAAASLRKWWSDPANKRARALKVSAEFASNPERREANKETLRAARVKRWADPANRAAQSERAKVWLAQRRLERAA